MKLLLVRVTVKMLSGTVKAANLDCLFSGEIAKRSYWGPYRARDFEIT